MKVSWLILAFVWLIGVVTVPAMAQAVPQRARAVHVPPGDMADAVESLARQCDVNVMYPSALLKGQKTQGVSGTLAPKAAFGKLLEGTPFELSEDEGALLITQAAKAPEAATAGRHETPLEQVLVEGWRETDRAARKGGQGAEAAGPRFVKWARHEFWISGCVDSGGDRSDGCSFRKEMKLIFERLGARDLVIHDRYASFSSLMPVANDAQGEPSRETARWVRVTFGGTGAPRRDRDGDDLMLYNSLKTGILPSFTTRNLKEESSGRMSVEVLQAVPLSAEATKTEDVVMKRKILPTLVGLLAPLVASAANLDIPAQPLGPSLETLSKQLGLQIEFDPKLVVLQDAPALKGEFSPEHALDTLLARTDLTYHLKDPQTIEIAVAVDEVIVHGRYERLSAMRKEYEKLEDKFYDEYNKLNTDHQWDVNCSREAPTGSRFERRVCTPVFVDTIEHEFYRNSLDGHGDGGNVWVWIQPKRDAFKKNMVDAVNQNPKLLELLMKRNAVQQRYEDLRKKKFAGGKVFVAD